MILSFDSEVVEGREGKLKLAQELIIKKCYTIHRNDKTCDDNKTDCALKHKCYHRPQASVHTIDVIKRLLKKNQQLFFSHSLTITNFFIVGASICVITPRSLFHLYIKN